MRVPRTFVFVDLSGFTNYTAAFGDDAAGRILSTFRGIVRTVALVGLACCAATIVLYGLLRGSWLDAVLAGIEVVAAGDGRDDQKNRSGAGVLYHRPEHGAAWDGQYRPNSGLSDILTHSDNVGMVWVGNLLGGEKMIDYLEKFGIELNEQGFCKADSTNLMKTSRPGVFVSGGFQGPIDIPESVFSASGAGSGSASGRGRGRSV